MGDDAVKKQCTDNEQAILDVIAEEGAMCSCDGCLLHGVCHKADDLAPNQYKCNRDGGKWCSETPPPKCISQTHNYHKLTLFEIKKWLGQYLSAAINKGHPCNATNTEYGPFCKSIDDDGNNGVFDEDGWNTSCYINGKTNCGGSLDMTGCQQVQQAYKKMGYAFDHNLIHQCNKDIHPPYYHKQPKSVTACHDKFQNKNGCAFWAKNGECVQSEVNSNWMRSNCAKSCGACPPTKTQQNLDIWVDKDALHNLHQMDIGKFSQAFFNVIENAGIPLVDYGSKKEREQKLKNLLYKTCSKYIDPIKNEKDFTQLHIVINKKLISGDDMVNYLVNHIATDIFTVLNPIQMKLNKCLKNKAEIEKNLQTCDNDKKADLAKYTKSLKDKNDEIKQLEAEIKKLNEVVNAIQTNLDFKETEYRRNELLSKNKNTKKSSLSIIIKLILSFAFLIGCIYFWIKIFKNQ